MRLLAAFATAVVGAFAQQPAGCAVAGTVINRITHEPVPRARVTLVSPGGYKYVTADNSGHWSFTGLVCGLSTVTASRAGFIEQQQTDRAPRAVALTAEAPLRGVTLELLPQSVITGKVVDENGDAMMSIAVVPYAVRIVDGRRGLVPAAQTMTNDLGEFRLAPLEAGRYIVCAEPAIAQTDYSDVCHPAPVESGAANAMAISPGQETHLDFTLSPVRRVRVSGNVTGSPAGMRPALQMSRAAYSRVQSHRPAISSFVAPDGKFTFDSVPPGSYVLSGQLTLEGQFYFARVPVEVGGSDIDNISLAVEPAITISGTVRAPSQETDSAPRIQVALRSSEPNASMGRIEWSDDYRAFTIYGVSPGNYILAVSSGQYFVKSATLGGQDITHGDFNIGSAPGPIEIVLSNETGSVEGDVVLDDDSPAPAASVMLFRDGAFIRSVPIQTGHFEARNLEPGDYTAYAWDNDREVAYAEPDWMRQYGKGGAAFSIQAGQTARIKLTRQTAPSEY